MTKVLPLDEINRDITHDLPSLQYDVHLTDSELVLIPLRKRNHELLLHACSQSAFLVAILNEITHIATSSDIGNKTEGLPRQRISVGIIGGGRLCGHIVKCLLVHGRCASHDITISTYQPEKIEHLTAMGVNCCHDNKSVIEQSDVTFIAVPSHQIAILAREVRAYKQRFVVPYVMSRSQADLVAMLGHEDIMKTDYLFNYEATVHHELPYTDIATSLEDKEVAERCFPLSNTTLGYVYSGPEWVRDALIMFYRYACRITKDPVKALNIVNMALFGDSEDRLALKSFNIAGTLIHNIKELPELLYDLVSVGDKMTYLNMDLESGKFSKDLTEKFKSIFKSKHVDLSKYDR